jgi:hypothetical protein
MLCYAFYAWSTTAFIAGISKEYRRGKKASEDTDYHNIIIIGRLYRKDIYQKASVAEIDSSGVVYFL